MPRDSLYKADNARFTIAGMNLEEVESSKRDAEMNILFNLLDEFHEHGLKPRCENGMESHEYSFGFLIDFLYDSYDNVKKWDIKNKTFQRMQPTLMSNPGIFREIDEDAWKQKSGFKNDCGFQSIDKGNHFSGDIPTWHANRESYYRLNQHEIDWDGRNSIDLSFLPNRHRSDFLLFKEITGFVLYSIEKEADKQGLTIEEFKKKFPDRYNKLMNILNENVAVAFHRDVINDKNGTIAALADRIGSDICKINFYTYEDQLTKNERKATGARRKIFSLINKNGEKQYISIDFAHGMFEFHDKNGTHLGEYRFNGMFNSVAESSHNFKTLRQ